MTNETQNNTLQMALSDDTLRRYAPSIFATQAYNGVSPKYSFIPTIDVVNVLRDKGWYPVKAMQSHVRLQDKRGYQKHMIRFRNAIAPITSDGYFPEIVLTNAHDRSSSFKLIAGLFRLVCMNGLVVAKSTFDNISVRHIGYTANKVIDAQGRILQALPGIIERVSAMKSIELSLFEQAKFAQQAIKAKWSKDAPIGWTQVLRVRRAADNHRDLFTTLNIVQENLMAGGLWGKYPTGERHTRRVSSVNENIRLNSAIWAIADSTMARLNAAR